MPRCLSLLLFFALVAGVVRAGDEAARVIVLANSAEPESVRLAEYYAAKRGVPAGNIIALPMPITEAIDWRAFLDTIFSPLEAELVKRGWIDAIGMNLTDGLGRKKYVISGHTVSYLVICRGVPLKINADSLLPADGPPGLSNPAFKTNAASVDSELALLAVGNLPLNGFVPNPLFNNDRPSTLQLNQIVKVGRLDGPGYDDARSLVDRALAAEQSGLIGRSYVDIGGPHPRGDQWLEAVATQLAGLGWDGDVERAGAFMPAWTRLDMPALYFGWYTEDANGPFTQPGFMFPPGAVALHIHSYSATSVRSSTRGWVGPLVARGVTATFGNVHEPYLEFTHQPQLVLKALARGDTLGEAAAYSVPVYSWQAITVGDPLYRPFKVGFVEQWERRDKLSSEQRAYVVLRRMHGLDLAGDRNGAIWSGLASEKAGPHLAVALATAKLQQAAGDVSGSRQTLKWVANRRNFTPMEAPLAVQAAERFKELGSPAESVGVWRRVLGDAARSREMRVAWLPKALEAARAAQDKRQVSDWDEEYRVLTAPPVPAPQVGGK